MDILASPLTGIFVAVALVVAYARSPRIRWLTALLLLLAWGIGAVGSVVLVLVLSYLPDGRYFAALLTVIVGAVLYVPWFLIGMPAIGRLFREGPDRNG